MAEPERAGDRGGEEYRRRRREAVALRYEKGRDEAPRVVASGKGAVAEKIVAAAREHDIPVKEDAPLARVLGQIELGTEIPPALYRAVAELLAFVFRLNRRVAGEKSGDSAPAGGRGRHGEDGEGSADNGNRKTAND